MPKTIFEYEWKGDEGGGLQDLHDRVGKVADRVDGLGTGMDRTSDRMGKASSRASRLGGVLSKMSSGAVSGLTTGVGLLSAGIVGLGAGAVATAKGILTLSEAGSEQDKVFARLSSSINGVVADVESGSAAFDRLQAQIGEQAGLTDFGDEAISDALSTYIDLAGTAEISTRDLSSILGVAEQRQLDASKAAEEYAKAKRGDVNALAKLLPLNKEQLKDLNSIEDASERGARATELLSSRYEGAANTIGTSRGSIKEASDAVGDLVQMGGRLVNQASFIPALVDPVVAVFRDLESGLAANSVRIQEVALSLAGGLVTGLELATEAGIFVYKSMADLGLGLSFVGAGFKTVVSLSEIGSRALLVFGSKVIGKVLEKLAEFGEKAEQVARAVGADGIADSLESARKGMQGFNDSVDSFAQGQLAGIRDEMGAIDETAQGLHEATGGWIQGYKDAERAGDAVRKVTDGMRDGLAKANSQLRPLESGYKEAGAGANAAADGLERQNKALKEQKKLTTDELYYAAERLDLENDLLLARQSGDRAAQIEAENQLALLDVKEAMAGAEDERLVALIERNGLLSAQLDKEAALAALEEEREQARRDAFEERLAREESAQEKRVEQAEKEAEVYQAASDRIGAALQALSGSDSEIARLSVALGGLSQALLEAGASYETMTAQGVKSQDALAASAASATGAIGGAIASQIEDTGKASLVRAGFASAEALIHAASGNPASAAIAGLGAAGHLATAALAGKSGGASGAGRGASGGAQAAAQVIQRDPARERELLAQSIVDGLSDSQNAGMTQIRFDFSGNVNLEDSPSMERRITEAVRRGLSSQGIDITRRV